MAHRAVAILGLLLASVFLIVTAHRFPLEKKLRQQYGIDRDWWLPIIALGIALSTALVAPQSILTTIQTKIDIIVLIFTFGVLAEGLYESGVFRYLAYTVVNYCNGNTRKLILGLFLTISLFTFFTTNDVVVLVVTPIIIEIAHQTDIKNLKLLLLSQFVAANTLSMGLLIGSPTNIIIAEALNISFIRYSILMTIPAILALITSTCILWAALTVFQSKNPNTSYAIQPKYSLPDTNPEPNITTAMAVWMTIFTIFLLLTIIVTELQLSLLWCSIPTITLSLLYWVLSQSHTKSIQEPISNLPYGVFFFGIVFFSFADAFASLPVFMTNIVPTVEALTNSPISPIIGLFGSGLLVNIFNDLPAAALIAEVLTTVELPSNSTRIVFIQAILAGLNIGAYVTQAGALAGIIWFNQIRVHKNKLQEQIEHSIIYPTRRDLFVYGIINFIFVSFTLTLFFLVELFILQLL